MIVGEKHSQICELDFAVMIYYHLKGCMVVLKWYSSTRLSLLSSSCRKGHREAAPDASVAKLNVRIRGI